MKTMFIRLRHEDHAAVLAEYVLMAALIGAAAAATVSTFGGGVAALIQQAVDAFPSGAETNTLAE